MRRRVVVLVLLLLIVGALILMAPLALRAWVDRQVADEIHTDVSAVPSAPVGIVSRSGEDSNPWPLARMLEPA